MSCLGAYREKAAKEQCEGIKAVAKGALSQNDVFMLKHLTETIEHLNGLEKGTRRVVPDSEDTF